MFPGAWPVEVPVVPDAPTAHRWLQDELAKDIYDTGPTLVERLIAWLLELWTKLSSAAGGMSSPWLAVGAVAVVLVLALAGYLIAGPLRRRARLTQRNVAIMADDARTALEMRAAAQVAAAQGDFSLAVVERFRAVVRASEERVVIDDAPGRTAEEAALAISMRFGEQSAELQNAAIIFDEVLYGEKPSSQAAYERMRALDDALVATRPQSTAPATAGGLR